MTAHRIEYLRRWRANNRDRLKELGRQWRAQNHEYCLEKTRQWRASNGDRERETARKRYAASREAALKTKYEWRRNNPEKYREIVRRGSANKRARKKGGFVEHVDPLVLFKRDKGICGICRKPVHANQFHVDHIFPLSRGGEHSYKNTQIAHPPCNNRKYCTIPNNAQLRIVFPVTETPAT